MLRALRIFIDQNGRQQKMKKSPAENNPAKQHPLRKLSKVDES